jgi:hypothetical protein
LGKHEEEKKRRVGRSKARAFEGHPSEPEQAVAAVDEQVLIGDLQRPLPLESQASQTKLFARAAFVG